MHNTGAQQQSSYQSLNVQVLTGERRKASASKQQIMCSLLQGSTDTSITSSCKQAPCYTYTAW
jgi:hypothetical protein